MQLKEIAVLITGGGSGLGAATARAMAAKGAKVAVLDQSKENALHWSPTSPTRSRSRPRSPRPRRPTASRGCW